MARKSKKTVETTDFRHGSAKRTNIPPAKIAGEGKVPDIGKQKYAYSPHLSPVLRFDPEGRADKVREIVEKACGGKSLTAKEQEILRAVGANWENPSLEWSGKKEEHDRHWRTVDPVALHIHERVSANAILSAAKRKDAERTLFADPELEYREAVQFYKHDMDWANRLILGDSLEVMSSLARREDLAGKVQMIYMDPPYGIEFASNFQPEVGNTQVKQQEDYLTREPEMVRAFRDTWELGIHTYLAYLRDRLVVARELLADSGSIFLQISDRNLHLVRQLLDEVFGRSNARGVLSFRTKIPLRTNFVANTHDYLLWYCRDIQSMKFRKIYQEKGVGDEGRFGMLEECSGLRRSMTKEERSTGESLPKDAMAFVTENLNSAGRTESCVFDFDFQGRSIGPTRGKSWKTNQRGMRQLARANRLYSNGGNLYYVLYHQDYPVQELHGVWNDTRGAMDKRYVVETYSKVVERCMLMTTDPGDLVLDPTCGSGTTASVAETWGRRWITTDTSRVAISLARQRLLTANYPNFEVVGTSRVGTTTEGCDPSAGFVYKTVPHITMGAIARNENLVPIFEKHEPFMQERLAQVNAAVGDVTDAIRSTLVAKLSDLVMGSGLRALGDAQKRRWLLPGTSAALISDVLRNNKKLKARHIAEYAATVPANERFEHWQVPFDVDSDWPTSLRNAVSEYREAWRAQMDEVNACIAANAEQEVLVDQPEIVSGVVRASGPFTVEGVIPEELRIGNEGQVDGTSNGGGDYPDICIEREVEMQNLHAFLNSMVGHLKSDGVTFPDNKNPKFARLESIFGSDSASALHAEGVWEGDEADGPARVGVGFGPQYGPVTAKQVEDLIRESSRRGYDELVVAGFSFDAEAHAIIHEDPNPKVRVHMAQIRPDLNAGMDGLLKDTPNSQLFTVFGSPAIDVDRDGDEYSVTLEGVDIYDPVKNTVRSTKATKVAAWFLDSDYDGRTFCITQAFFPDQDAWEKLAKALRDVIEPETFAAFKGTTSLPFHAGEHKQIAVKVIDPRGSEVMTIHKLEG